MLGCEEAPDYLNHPGDADDGLGEVLDVELLRVDHQGRSPSSLVWPPLMRIRDHYKVIYI